MSFTPVFPAILARADFAIVRFSLDLLTACRLEPFALLGLRQGLLRAGRELLGTRADNLFFPSLSGDPAAVRRFQKPAPAFVLRPEPLRRSLWREGDRLNLDVLFLGDGLPLIDDFVAVLRHLGDGGLIEGEGAFEIVEASCRTATGVWRPLPLLPHGATASSDIHPLSAWLDNLLPLPATLVLELTTPARLLAGGQALRRPRFDQILPFMLRRVTSMLSYHCHLEPVDDPALLLAAARRIESTWRATDWIDWRTLADTGAAEKVGGLTGQLQLSGDGLDEAGWVLALATLFGIGRGAAYGAGQMRLISVPQ